MVRLLKSWRESPEVPDEWRPSKPPNAVVRERVRNPEVIKALRALLPGRWKKVYRKGQDGTEIHYFEHLSGAVAFVKHVIK